MVTTPCVLAVMAALYIGTVHSVRTGDERYGSELDAGLFYVFSDKAIDIIDPVRLTVVKTLTTDQSGAPLTNAGSNGGSANESRTWNDAVYLQDPSENLAYIFINEGDVYNRTDGTQYSYVTVVDTNTQEVIKRIEVAPRPVHMFAVPETLEVWAHSDAEGTFDVISISDTDRINTTVAAFVKKFGHGKLLVDESIFPLAYATNVNEQVLEVIDLQAQKRVAAYDYNASLPDPSICTGTHALVYSTRNKHVYAECADGMGVLEWDSVTNSLVHFFPNQTGYLSAAPADDKILVLFYDTPTISILEPRGNGQASAVLYEVEVEGKPDHSPVYWSNSTGPDPEAATDYIVFLGLTTNTNMANLRAAAAVSVDGAPGSAQDPHYFAAPVDCAYSDTAAAMEAYATGNADAKLVLATNADGTAVTPQCGSCAPGVDPPVASAYNASLSGMRWFRLSSVEAAAAANTTYEAPLIPAGAALQTQNGDTDGNECSFAEVYRKSKRGGNWVTVVADLPSPSLYIIDPSRQVVHGVVNTTGASPKTIVWAPTKNAGIELDASAAGYAPFAGPGPAPAQVNGDSAAGAAPAPAPTSAAGAAQMLSYRALAVGLVVALFSMSFA